jgi:hypothetical protein
MRHRVANQSISLPAAEQRYGGPFHRDEGRTRYAIVPIIAPTGWASLSQDLGEGSWDKAKLG